MSKKQAYNPFQGPNYEKYQSLNQHLQRQNAKLLKERSKIQHHGEYYDGPISQQTIIDKNELSIDDDDDDEQDHVGLPRFQVSDRANNNFQAKNSRKSVREQIGQKGELVGDDVMQMIEEIERKALAEIQSLRADKIKLLKKLNKQMKEHNNEKKRSAQFERKVVNSNQEIKKNITKPRRKPSQPKTPANIIYEEEEQNSPSPSATYHHPQQNDRPIQDNFNIQSPDIPQGGRQNYNGSNGYNGREAYENGSEIAQSPIQSPQTVPSPRNQPRLNNQNVIPSQSFYYLDRTPKMHNNFYNQSSQVQGQLENEIHRLTLQNAQMRNTIQRSNANFTNFPVKNQLRNELHELAARAQRYEQMLHKSRNIHTGPEGFDGSQLETLLLQGTQITQQGQRLMKAKSNPQLRSSIGVNRNQLSNQLQNSRNSGRANNNTRYGLEEYENLIANMKRTANS